MIGPDRGLFGGGTSGDVIERHKKYANAAGELDVIVFAPPPYRDVRISTNLRVFSSRSSKLTHWRGAVRRAEELIEDQPYDLLVCQELAAPSGARIRQKFGIPLIIGIHSMFYSNSWLGTRPERWYLYWRIRRALSAADAFG